MCTWYSCLPNGGLVQPTLRNLLQAGCRRRCGMVPTWSLKAESCTVVFITCVTTAVTSSLNRCLSFCSAPTTASLCWVKLRSVLRSIMLIAVLRFCSNVCTCLSLCWLWGGSPALPWLVEQVVPSLYWQESKPSKCLSCGRSLVSDGGERPAGPRRFLHYAWLNFLFYERFYFHTNENKPNFQGVYAHNICIV